MPAAGDWRWRFGAYIDRGSGAPASGRRRRAWRTPPSLADALFATSDETASDSPGRKLALHNVVVCADRGVSNRAELATEHAAEDFHRQKERIPWTHPTGVVQRQAASRDGAVKYADE